MADRIISTGWHYNYGWLRRPELDNNGWYCYEDGDGDLYLTDYPNFKKRLKLDCRLDSETGEKYLCFTKSDVKIKK
jgi:hypothetical protein